MYEVSARPLSPALRKSVVYQLFLRAFTPAGTLRAAARLLPHIADLGVDIVYLCPIAQADDDACRAYWSERQKASHTENPQNPYRIQDYHAIDPEYGTDEDLRAFVAQAHRLHMRVLLDLVYYHCGPHAVFLDAHPDFVKRDAEGRIDYGDWHFPMLQFENADLREYLWNNMTYLIERFDVDGYRCDVGDGCPLDFWLEGRKRIQALKPDAILINEGVNPDALLEAFDSNYDFGWSGVTVRACRGETSVQAVVDYWQKNHAMMPRGGRCLRALDTHDIVNDSYEERIETVMGSRAVQALLCLNFTLDGIPFLYNGNEVADTARHSIFANRFHSPALRIDWSNALTQAGQTRRILLRTLCALRHENPALSEGETEWLAHDAHASMLAFSRVCAAQRLTVLINLSQRPVTATLAQDAPVRTLLEEGALLTPQASGLRADLLPFGFVVFA